jgi:adenine-specific DNA-methyltransferase
MSEKMDGLSMDIAAAEQDKLRAVFPQCFTEGKLDERKLLELLGTFDTLDENDREKYEFRWKGKQEALQLAAKRSAGTLRPCPEESVDWDTTRNLYIEGDNLEVLKLLQTSYYRKVKMIYIDPPYNTGNDFVYADDFADPLARYREVTQQTTKSNPESMGRFHTNWLNMMLPRLRLAANLLRDDGVIFISIDDNEVHNLRKLCDEVFGEENFVAQLIWKKKFSPQNDDKYITATHDIILMFARNKPSFSPKLQVRSQEALEKFGNPDNDSRGVWTSGDLTSKTKAKGHSYEIVSPSGKVFLLPSGRQWAPAYETYAELRNDNRIWFGESGDNAPRQKQFLTEIQAGVVPISILYHKEVGHNQEAKQELNKVIPSLGNSFETPKPVRLIRKLLNMVDFAPNDIVLDFFSGSATTAHAIMQLNAEDGGNRRFILVQIPEVCDEKSEAAKAGYKNICEIGKERTRRAGSKLKEILVQDGGDFRHLAKSIPEAPQKTFFDEDSAQSFTVPIIPARWSAADESVENKAMADNLDIGFRVFKLDSSNLKQWDNSPITGENAAEQFAQRMIGMLEFLKSDRSDIDVVYEVVLKLGQDLCEPICSIDVGNGRQVYGVGENVKFIVCLAENITVVESKIMADYAPGRIVFADRCFNSSTDKSNVKLTLRDRGMVIRVL